MKPSAPALASILAPRASLTRRRLVTIIAVSAILALVLVAFVFSRLTRSSQPMSAFVTEPLKRGDISLTITATGNLEPTNEVTVGSELSGTTLEVYVDTNDRVTKGQTVLIIEAMKVMNAIQAPAAGTVNAIHVQDGQPVEFGEPLLVIS